MKIWICRGRWGKLSRILLLRPQAEVCDETFSLGCCASRVINCACSGIGVIIISLIVCMISGLSFLNAFGSSYPIGGACWSIEWGKLDSNKTSWKQLLFISIKSCKNTWLKPVVNAQTRSLLNFARNHNCDSWLMAQLRRHGSSCPVLHHFGSLLVRPNVRFPDLIQTSYSIR